MSTAWLEQIKWGADGLVPAIAQDSATGKILMVAWMNAEALRLTLEQRRAVYWSRSRKKLWFKGEESGHQQMVSDIRTDCDYDVILLSVKQQGGIACHTGRESCFYHQLDGEQWTAVEPVLKDPESIYQKGN